MRLLLFVASFAFLSADVFAQQTWSTRRNIPGGAFLWGIAHGSRGLVAVGTNGRILTSPEGDTWTARTSGTSAWLTSVAYGNNQYVIVGDAGLVLTSTDAQSWTRATVPVNTPRLNKVLHGDGRWIAVGENGAMLTSTDDARTWTSLPRLGFTGWLRGLAHHPGAWVVVGQNGQFAFSNDGVQWTPRVTLVTHDFESAAFITNVGITTTSSSGVRYNNSYRTFLAAGSDGSTLQISYTQYQDQTVVATHTPTVRAIPTTARIRGLTAAFGMIVATGELGEVARAARAAGPWTRVASGTNRTLTDSVYAFDAFFAIGEDETILRSEPVYPGRFANVSTRGFVGLGDDTMIAGTIIAGSAPKQMLIRAIGPALADFGVLNPLPDPELLVFDGNGRVIASNRGWTTQPSPNTLLTPTSQVGAFPLDANRADSALLLTLSPGSYTFHVRSATHRTGVALVEAYEVSGGSPSATRTANLSTRLQAGVNENILIAGLAISGSSARTVLVRGIGPSLSRFNVKAPLADPLLRIVRDDGIVIAQNDNWGTVTVVDGRPVLPDEIRDISAAVGAFPLELGSKDAALLLTLAPGNYTLQISGVGGTTGTALVEAYEAP